MVQLPAATNVTVDPDTVHIEVVVDENVTARPEVVVAATLNGALPNVFPDNVPNVIVWAAFATANVLSMFGAGA